MGVSDWIGGHDWNQGDMWEWLNWEWWCCWTAYSDQVIGDQLHFALELDLNVGKNECGTDLTLNFVVVLALEDLDLDLELGY